MAIIIAVFLIIIVLAKVLKDKSGEHKYSVKEKAWREGTDRFDAAYMDKSIEDAIRVLFDDKDRLEEAHREVDLAFQQMPHWCGESLYLHPSEFAYKNNKFTQKAYKDLSKKMERDRQLALDIMLANRGKVASNATWSGYPSYVTQPYSDAFQLIKEQQFEFVAWIRDTLQKQGVQLTPICVTSAGGVTYGWLGSHHAPDPPFGTKTYRPFQHSLIEPPQVAVAKPYYDNDSNDHRGR